MPFSNHISQTIKYQFQNQIGVERLDVVVHFERHSIPIWSLAYNSSSDLEESTWRDGNVEIQITEEFNYTVTFPST